MGEKKVYHTPELRKFGTVKEGTRTQAGGFLYDNGTTTISLFASNQSE
jgi:hypothetical protein